MSIRTRLLLLVLAVWLPAAAGFGLLARGTYLREADAARDRVLQLADSLHFMVDRELDKRVTLARALAASASLRERDWGGFHEQASLALLGTESWAVLVGPVEQFASTRDVIAGRLPTPRPPRAPFAIDAERVEFMPMGDDSRGRASIEVLVPLSAAANPELNVGVVFEPGLIQAIVDGQTPPEGSVITVVDSRQRVVARSREPARWLGHEPSEPMRERIRARYSGFVESVTLDGMPALSYLSRPGRHGWTTVIALPLSGLSDVAQRATLQAVGASSVLLALGLLLALAAARGISKPLLALRDGAAQLGFDAIPPKLRTGLIETDEVSVALHEAGRRTAESTHMLATRVADAVTQAEQAQARLLEARKHEAIGRLTGGLAHDFNNLLQTITTALQMLERSKPTAPQQRVLQAAVRASSRAAGLVRQMLSFGRAQPLMPRPVDLADFLLMSSELTAKAVGERIRFDARIPPGLPPVHADATQLELALLNLIFNARDAMADGGHIAFSVREATADEAAALGGGHFLCIEVADDGAGMDAETATRAFEPYFTTKEVGRGSGLGLAQVLAFAKQSGGDARIDSRPGAGSCVQLWLPVSEAPFEEPEDAPVEVDTGRALSVLMVEDDALVASVVAPALGGAGHQVRICPTADEALQMLKADERPDVVFTDVMMAGEMNGMDLAAWCNRQRPPLPVVVATGYSAQDLPAGAQVLRKLYTVESLLQALQNAASPGARSGRMPLPRDAESTAAARP